METVVLNGLQAFAMAGGQGGGQGGMWDMVIMMVVIMAMMYFIAIRPQKKRERERQEMLKRIKVGDKVRSIGGILGTVSAVSETTVTVAVCDKVTIEFVRDAVNLVEDTPVKDAKK